MADFEKQEPCDSVKIWSRQIMTSEMFDYGFNIFKRFNFDIQNGDVCGKTGCLYTNWAYAAHVHKTKSGLASVCVEMV
jgi:hypothetical protein